MGKNWKCSCNRKFKHCDGLKCNMHNGVYIVCQDNSCIFCDEKSKVYAKGNCENNYLGNIGNCVICKTPTRCLECKPGY